VSKSALENHIFSNLNIEEHCRFSSVSIIKEKYRRALQVLSSVNHNRNMIRKDVGESAGRGAWVVLFPF